MPKKPFLFLNAAAERHCSESSQRKGNVKFAPHTEAFLFASISTSSQCRTMRCNQMSANKAIKEISGESKRPLIPISFKRVLAPNLRNISFREWLFFFPIQAWSCSSDLTSFAHKDSDALRAPKAPSARICMHTRTKMLSHIPATRVYSQQAPRTNSAPPHILPRPCPPPPPPPASAPIHTSWTTTTSNC